MTEPANYGYAGLSVTLPHVIDNVGAHLDDSLIERDEQARHVAQTLVDLSEGVYTLGKLLRSDDGSERIHNRRTNNEKYYDAGSALTLVKKKIEELFNHACIVGHQALRLLETMWGYCHRVEQDEPDETAWRLARACYYTWDH